MTTSGDGVNAWRGAIPAAVTLGIEVLLATAGEVRARLEYNPGLCTSGGVLHGGILMTLADTAGAICAFLNLPDGANATTTVESKTNFIRPVRSGHCEAVSRPLHAGSRFVIVETDLVTADARLAARTTQTQAVIRSS